MIQETTLALNMTSYALLRKLRDKGIPSSWNLRVLDEPLNAKARALTYKSYLLSFEYLSASSLLVF